MGDNKRFYITDTDKEWVTDTFKWLVKSYGYPSGDFNPILYTETFFPKSFAHKQIAIEPLLQDLCLLNKIAPSKISFTVVEDIRDGSETPYSFQGMPFECELEAIKTDSGHNYKLIFAKSIIKNPKRLLFNVVFQFIQIRLAEVNIDWIHNEHHFVFYLIGIFKGWGVILAQTITDVGKQTDGFWQRSWNFTSSMPVPVMVYAMALHSSMIDQPNPAWKNFLPSDMKKEFENAISYIAQDANPVINKQELLAKSFFKEAFQYSKQKNFDDAISAYQKAIFLTQSNSLKATIYNNIGYSHLWKTEYQKSISNFQKALEINPSFGYANDNIGFAFIMLGDTDTGKYYLSIAQQTKENDAAYSYRNMALYHQKRNEVSKARECFQKAFENIKIPVDWLEYFYARFLFEQGEIEQAMSYMEMAVEKGEPDAIKWMSEIKSTDK
ncbi:MAG: tetratricopeptide repeat protein [Bacteroidetes bacterium]|nr:tetratricopeptide repeat protein [Bacteroidota bacterium]